MVQNAIVEKGCAEVYCSLNALAFHRRGILHFITKQDLMHINQLVKEKSAFPDENKFISLGKLTGDAIAIGAAIPLIKEFIGSL